MKRFKRGRVPEWYAELGDLDNEEWQLGARCLQRVLWEYGRGEYTLWRRTGRIPLTGTFTRPKIDLHVGPLLRDSCTWEYKTWVKAIRREFEFQARRTPLVLRAKTEEERLRLLLMPLLLPVKEDRDLSDLLVRRWSDGVTALLCVRAPEGTRPVTASEARAVGADPGAWWEAALDHVRAEPIHLTTGTEGGVPEFVHARGEDRFGMGHLLRIGELTRWPLHRLGERLGGPAQHGVLVGILAEPGLFMYHRIVRRVWAQAIVAGMRKFTPGTDTEPSFTAISGVHWWKDGEAVQVATSTEVSPRLAELLASVPE
ncbi:MULTISPECIES: hypothetical protein [unclassified Streptomyces]|uniref:hypothetical protein n=1 Tax=unclassified Streptomyces TaxID=2593676 RepID=UPI0023657358|nr:MULTISPECIES: hypothetical protein [unclassified Streptomyces]MDF3146896.1 hypothetical protein [Streptomyces sp. T21Q-yed]WDF42147.1 hypothetical protein PBV52_37795 [Streptomyces sp. T12]